MTIQTLFHAWNVSGAYTSIEAKASDGGRLALQTTNHQMVVPVLKYTLTKTIKQDKLLNRKLSFNRGFSYYETASLA